MYCNFLHPHWYLLLMKKFFSFQGLLSSATSLPFWWSSWGLSCCLTLYIMDWELWERKEKKIQMLELSNVFAGVEWKTMEVSYVFTRFKILHWCIFPHVAILLYKTMVISYMFQISASRCIPRTGFHPISLCTLRTHHIQFSWHQSFEVSLTVVSIYEWFDFLLLNIRGN